MKYAHKILTALIVATLCAFVFTSCQGSPQHAAAVQQKWNDVWADGVMTPQEQKEFLALLQEEGDVSQWPQMVGAGIASILASFFGVNAYRNSREAKVWGTPEAPKGT